MKRCLALLIVAGLLTGCAQEGGPPPVQRTYPVYGHALDELFTDARGYTVCRFYDEGDYRYYVVGPNGAQMLPTTHVVESDSSPIIIGTVVGTDGRRDDHDHDSGHGGSEHGGGGEHSGGGGSSGSGENKK